MHVNSELLRFANNLQGNRQRRRQQNAAIRHAHDVLAPGQLLHSLAESTIFEQRRATFATRPFDHRRLKVNQEIGHP